MCGIAGVVSAGLLPDASLRRTMLTRQGHRGPDGEGEWLRPPAQGQPAVWLGHRRLAIIDLSDAAGQPMAGSDGALRITYNGEIYNYIELMDELTSLGHRFRTHSDTEVILAAYERWGVASLDRLNGMFAFAIWDERRSELFAARDRFGEKPFHYAWNPAAGTFAFASEIKALLVLPDIDASLNEDALCRFITFREMAGTEATIWKGVRRLRHGHWLRVSCDPGGLKLETRRYWNIALEKENALPLADASKRFAELFRDSVRLRLRSDVPVGTSLSGGLDSSAIVCQIHALGAARDQRTFSARMADPALDEGAHIQTVLQHTGISGAEVWPTAEDLQRSFSAFCYHQEEPCFSTSPFAQYLVMRLASENGVTVLLDGQGADELLAGYTSYFLTRYADLATTRQFLSLFREYRAFERHHGSGFPLSLKALVAKAAPILQRLRRHHPAADAGPSLDAPSCWNRDWLRSFGGQSRQPLPVDHQRDALTCRLYADALTGPLQELLRYADRNSMAWSREVRQPFLDHRIAEFLFSLPAEFKLAGGETKVIMRHALAGLLPESIRQRQDKIGYRTPLATWLSGNASSWVQERIEHASRQLQGIVDPHWVDARMNAVPAGAFTKGAEDVFAMLTVAECLTQTPTASHSMGS